MFIEGYFTSVLIAAGFLLMVIPFSLEARHFYNGRKKLACATVLIGIAMVIGGLAIDYNNYSINKQKELLDHEQKINIAIEQEKLLSAPVLVDNITAISTRIYSINDTQAATRIILCEYYGAETENYWTYSVETYANPGNISAEWTQISKSVIPETHKEIPLIRRASGKNGTLVYEMEKKYTIAKNGHKTVLFF